MRATAEIHQLRGAGAAVCHEDCRRAIADSSYETHRTTDPCCGSMRHSLHTVTRRPARAPQETLRRRREVLIELALDERITPDEFRQAIAEPCCTISSVQRLPREAGSHR
jgi:hypothetical protein